MLLSREAMPTFEFNGLSAGPVTSALVSMRVEPSSSPTSINGWISEAPREPPWIGDHEAGEWPAMILLQDQWGGFQSSLDETDSTGPVEDGNGEFADVPDPMSSTDDESSAEELIYEGLDELPAIPWTNDHTVEGFLDPSRTLVAYKVPVGPETGSLHLTLHPLMDGSEVWPMIDQLFLVDPEGRILAKITAAPFQGDGGGGQKLLVLLSGATEGSELVVHLTLGGAQSPSPPGIPPGSSGGGFDIEPPPSFVESTGFLFNVQRSDPAPSSSTLEEPPLTWPAAPIGTAPPTTSNRVGGWNSLPAATLVLDGVIRLERGWSASAGTPTSARSGAKPVSRGAGGSSVYLGPLVSRGASPLGPTLATSNDGPTQMIDRENRAVDEAIERIEVELDSGLLANLKQRDALASEWGAEVGGRFSARPEAPEPPMAAIPGPGGLPVLVSLPGRRLPRAEALALTEHLQSRSVEEALTAEVPGQPPTANQVAGDVEVARAGLATRAAGLIVGLGLATGPLYPDLIALARKRFARAKRSAKSRRWPFRGGSTRPAY